jgi:hypothetical protein
VQRRKLYLGETFNLRARIQRHLENLPALLSALGLDPAAATKLRVKTVSVPSESLSHRLGLQSRLMGTLRTRPAGNASFETQAYTA